MEEPKVRVNDKETQILQRLAAQVPENGLILEIGSAWGHSTFALAQASLDSVTIVAIDPWSLFPRNGWSEHEGLFWKNMEPFKERLVAIKSFSQDVDVEKILGEKEIDLLFIDGDHHRNAVRDDYSKYHGFLKLGGIIVFHDYGLLAGVTKAVNWHVVPSGLWDFHVEERLWIGKRI